MVVAVARETSRTGGQLSTRGRRVEKQGGFDSRVHELRPRLATVVTKDIVVGRFQVDVVLLEVLWSAKKTSWSGNESRKKKDCRELTEYSSSVPRIFAILTS